MLHYCSACMPIHHDSSAEQLCSSTCQCQLELADSRRSDLWQGKLCRPLWQSTNSLDCQVFVIRDVHHALRQGILLAGHKRSCSRSRSYGCHQWQLLQHEHIHLHHRCLGKWQRDCHHSSRGVCSLQWCPLLSGRQDAHSSMFFSHL